MIPDAEIISLLGTILTKLEVGEFTVKVGAHQSFKIASVSLALPFS